MVAVKRMGNISMKITYFEVGYLKSLLYLHLKSCYLLLFYEKTMY
jgi:hypothetical protein